MGDSEKASFVERVPCKTVVSRGHWLRLIRCSVPHCGRSLRSGCRVGLLLAFGDADGSTVLWPSTTV